MISVLFPVNATNILQTLNITVFKTFKAILKREIDKNIIETISPPLTKR